jgi:hypothetical protein
MARSTPNVRWKLLQPGVDLAVITLNPGNAQPSSSLYAVRVDPDRARLQVALASEMRSGSRTAAEWCRTTPLSVAINVGMFQSDQSSNVGYLRHGRHLNHGSTPIGPFSP